MAELSDIQDKVNIAKLYYQQEAAAERLKLLSGYGDINRLNPLKRLIKGLTFQIIAEVNDDTTSALYKCLMAIISTFSAPYVLDPSVVYPGNTQPGVIGRAVKVVSNSSTGNLTKEYLNTNYPYPEYQEGDIVYVPAAFLQYTKLQNTIDSEWNEAPFNYASSPPVQDVFPMIFPFILS